MTTAVFLEHHDGKLEKGALGVLGKAASLGGDVAGVILGSGVEELAAEAGRHGATRVYVADTVELEAPLPAVVAVSDAINEPRYPSLKGIMGAKSKPQDTVGIGDIGLSANDVGEAGSRTEVLALGEPPARGESRRIEDDGSGAQQILDFLVEKKLV